jgi:hypothetical protein
MCGTTTWVLADLSDDDLRERLWRVVASDAGLGEVLAEFGSAGAVAAIPSFALVHLVDGLERAVLRGDATISLGEGDERIDLACPPGLLPWIEYPATGRTSAVRLASPGAPETSSLLPIRGGVALADVLQTGVAPVVESRAPAPQDPEPEQEPPSRPDREPATPPRETPVELPMAGPSPATYDFLFQATQRRSVEEAAVRAPGDEAEFETPADPAAFNDGTTLRETMPDPDEIPAMESAPATAGPLIHSVPGMNDAPSHSPQLDDLARATTGGDLDERTVNRAQMRELAEEAHRSVGPTVHALTCPNGHLNPPNAHVCRVCGAALPSVAPVTVPRPVLGVLRLSTGGNVTLDRGALFGRKPEASNEGTERPHVVQLASPNQDISRNHLEVRLDGWHVLVVDLHSTNGTVVTIPGQPPQRLRGGEQLLIPPGSRVNLADEVSFVYEVDS